MKTSYLILSMLMCYIRSVHSVASEEVTVSVTLPIALPLQVPAGKSFREAAAEFVERNQLPSVNIEVLEKALYDRWNQMQSEVMKRDQCMEWQIQHNVIPTKNWGSLPEDNRVEWLKYDCDSHVPSQPPKALVELDVIVDNTRLALRAYEGDTVKSAVKRFCDMIGINFEENGQGLIDALFAKLQEKQQPQPSKEKTFLFSIPFEIDGQLLRLRVHEGDDLNELVSSFCKENELDIEKFGQTIANVVIQTTKQLQEKLAEEAKTPATEIASEPKLLLSIPVSIDSKELDNLNLYDGDYVEQTIKEFCKKNGIDHEAYGQLLLQQVTTRTQALAQESK